MLLTRIVTGEATSPDKRCYRPLGFSQFPVTTNQMG
jgi:hypothetical protein